MNWIMIATMAGVVISNGHFTKDHCELEASFFRDKGALADCVKAPEKKEVIIQNGTTILEYGNCYRDKYGNILSCNGPGISTEKFDCVAPVPNHNGDAYVVPCPKK